MTDVILPLAPYRMTLASYLTDAGRLQEASSDFSCRCGRQVMASGFFDVRDRSDFGGASWVCQTCASDLMRREAAAHEEACRIAREQAGQLGEERLNDLRAQREIALVRSDWTQLADNRTRIGATASAAWDAYRQAVRDWFAVARDTGTVGDFPAAPE